MHLFGHIVAYTSIPLFCVALALYSSQFEKIATDSARVAWEALRTALTCMPDLPVSNLPPILGEIAWFIWFIASLPAFMLLVIAAFLLVVAMILFVLKLVAWVLALSPIFSCLVVIPLATYCVWERTGWLFEWRSYWKVRHPLEASVYRQELRDVLPSNGLGSNDTIGIVCAYIDFDTD